MRRMRPQRPVFTINYYSLHSTLLQSGLVWALSARVAPRSNVEWGFGIVCAVGRSKLNLCTNLLDLENLLRAFKPPHTFLPPTWRHPILQTAALFLQLCSLHWFNEKISMHALCVQRTMLTITNQKLAT